MDLPGHVVLTIVDATRQRLHTLDITRGRRAIILVIRVVAQRRHNTVQIRLLYTVVDIDLVGVQCSGVRERWQDRFGQIAGERVLVRTRQPWVDWISGMHYTARQCYDL